jgi:hypothetical protein
VEADQPSDPYLMTGYDRKALHLAHDAPGPVRFSLEVDITGEGTWVHQESYPVPPGDGRDNPFSRKRSQRTGPG